MRYFLILLVFFSMGQEICSQNLDSSNNTVAIIDDWRNTNTKIPIYDSLLVKFKVHRIKKTDEAYIIDIDVKNKVRYFPFTIISLKGEKQKNVKKIKRGNWYEFVLLSYYPLEKAIVKSNPFRIYTIDGVRVGCGDLRTGWIVTTPNLQGLYYIPPSKNEPCK